MHAVLVTYENDASVQEVKTHPDNMGFAQELKGVAGLISKTWIYDDGAYGGFYVFTDEASAKGYIDGSLFQGGVVEDPTNRKLDIRHFEVLDELSAMTGVRSEPLGAA